MQDISTQLNSGVAKSNDVTDESSTTLFHQTYPQGWARKVRRIGRLSPKQKDYIEQLFQKGPTSNTKLSPEQMA